MGWFEGRPARRHGFAAAALAAVWLVACSSVEVTDKIDYRSAAPPRPLDVPPDLSALPKDDRFQVPGTASASKSGAAPATGGVVPAVSVAKMERDGSQRWLAVDLPPEKVYEQVKEMFQSVGLGIERDDPKLGIIETVWAENRARLPLDFIRRTIGSALDAIYSTSELDKYRARIERTPDNTTEVFISHRGMKEVYTSTQQERTVWEPRPSEPELEAELLRRLQLRFAPAAVQTAAATAPAAPDTAKAPPPPQNAHFIKGETPADSKVQIDEPFDRAWRRVGLALDRGGFTVEDRDRTKGVYFVRYLDPEFEAKQRDKQGVFSRIFGRDPKIQAQQFRILLAERGNGTDVTVLDKDGKPEAGATGTKILAQITEQLR